MTIYFLYLAGFLILACGGLVCRAYVLRLPGIVMVDPPTMLYLSYLLYSASLPLSRLFFESAPLDVDAKLMGYHMLGSVGMLLGTVFVVPALRRSTPEFVRSGWKVAERAPQLTQEFRPKLYCAILVVLVLRYGWILLEALGFDIRNIFQPYGFEVAEGFSESSVLSILTYFGLYSALLFGVIWHRMYAPLPRWLFLMVVSIIAALGAFWLLRGSRNMVMLMFLPTAAVVMYRRSVPVVVAAVFLTLAILSMYVVGVVRNLGAGTLSRSDYFDIVASVDPLQGELGTSYSVLTRAVGLGLEAERSYGSGYFISPLINLVPRSLWPTRPDTPAIEFSKIYFNTDNLSEGLGYSPVLEALVNFGPLGILGVFAAVTALVLWAFSGGKFLSVRGLMIMAFVMPIIVNWNRIDLSTTLKMYSGFLFMALVLPWVLLKPRTLRMRQ